MRASRLSPLVLLAALVLPGTAGAAVGQAGEYVVLYANGATAAEGRQAVQAAGGTIVHENTAVGLATVHADGAGFAERADRQPALVGAAADRSIGRAPADRVKRDVVEQDAGAVRASERSRGSGPEPLSGLQWNLRMIHATPDGSYAVERGRKAVRVGIIDTGVDGRHPDIAPNFRADLSRNFTTDIPAIDGPCEEEPEGLARTPTTSTRTATGRTSPARSAPRSTAWGSGASRPTCRSSTCAPGRTRASSSSARRSTR